MVHLSDYILPSNECKARAGLNIFTCSINIARNQEVVGEHYLRSVSGQFGRAAKTQRLLSTT